MHDRQTNTINIFDIAGHGQTFLSQADRKFPRRNLQVLFEFGLLYVGPRRVNFEAENTNMEGIGVVV
jgi:hypothetical protein